MTKNKIQINLELKIEIIKQVQNHPKTNLHQVFSPSSSMNFLKKNTTFYLPNSTFFQSSFLVSPP
jgi:hypothetical protein